MSVVTMGPSLFDHFVFAVASVLPTDPGGPHQRAVLGVPSPIPQRGLRRCVGLTPMYVSPPGSVCRTPWVRILHLMGMHTSYAKRPCLIRECDSLEGHQTVWRTTRLHGHGDDPVIWVVVRARVCVFCVCRGWAIRSVCGGPNPSPDRETPPLSQRLIHHGVELDQERFDNPSVHPMLCNVV